MIFGSQSVITMKEHLMEKEFYLSRTLFICRGFCQKLVKYGVIIIFFCFQLSTCDQIIFLLNLCALKI